MSGLRVNSGTRTRRSEIACQLASSPMRVFARQVEYALGVPVKRSHNPNPRKHRWPVLFPLRAAPASRPGIYVSICVSKDLVRRPAGHPIRSRPTPGTAGTRLELPATLARRMARPRVAVAMAVNFFSQLWACSIIFGRSFSSGFHPSFIN
jgi:hypothetical protein